MVLRPVFLLIFGDIAGDCRGMEATLLPADSGYRETIRPCSSDERVEPRLHNCQSLQIVKGWLLLIKYLGWI